MIIDGVKSYWQLKAALASSHWTPERLRARQEERLGKLLVHAYRRVPLYRRLYDEAGFQPEAFRSMADIERIPVLHRQHLKGARPEEVVASGIDLRHCSAYGASGTTGTPLHVYLGPAEERWHRVSAMRILMEHGLRWTDRVLEISYTLGEELWIQKLGIHRKDWRSLLDPPESWAKCLAEKKHEVIVTYATALAALAEAVESLGLETTPPRLIVSVSETLTPATRHLVQRVLGTDPVDVYGLAELSNFAWECERRCGFHVSADSHIVEIPRPSGEAGPIIVTGLGMWTMPIIRYDTGDWAEADIRLCACGRSLPKISHLLGRAFDTVVLPNGRRMFWSVFYQILSEYDAINRWRVIQQKRDVVTIQLASSCKDADLFNKIRLDLRREIPEEVALNIERVDAIPIVPGKKERLVTSQLPPES